MNATTDASHSHGVGPKSYRTMLEAVVYDANHHVVPVSFYHSAGSECENLGEGYLEY